jgi:hypothetical protein
MGLSSTSKNGSLLLVSWGVDSMFSVFSGLISREFSVSRREVSVGAAAAMTGPRLACGSMVITVLSSMSFTV